MNDNTLCCCQQYSWSNKAIFTSPTILIVFGVQKYVECLEMLADSDSRSKRLLQHNEFKDISNQEGKQGVALQDFV